MSMMGSSSEDDTSKAHKGNTISGNDKQQKPQVESEQVMTNGTGSEHTSDVESVSEESKRRNITEITKIIELPQKIDQSATDNSLSADYQFLGFESVSLSNDQNRNLEAFHRVLDEFNIPYDKKETLGKEKEDSESEKKEESDEEKEEDKKSDEDMTVDAAIVVSDSDSDQMEIDMDNNDKDSSRAIDSDIESVKGDMAKVEYCGTCSAEVDDAEEGIFCDGRCERWFHLRCSGLSRGEYDELSMDENAKWACSKCSGKPIQPAAGSKPLLSVRKDLGQISTPPLKRRSMNKEGRTPKVDIANPAFLKPFDFGWKRELVYRSTNDNQNRRQGDVYYYTAQGKKLRSLREISDYLAGTDLTIDNFTFWKEPLGIEDSQKEIIRDAKLKLINKDQDGAPSPKQKLLTPKTPKTPKVTPKLIATVSPEDLPVTLKVPASVTPRVVLKKPIGSVGAKFKATLTKSTPVQPQNKGVESDKISNHLKTANTNLKQDWEDLELDSVPVFEMSQRNKFKRYGLLANAKCARERKIESSAGDNDPPLYVDEGMTNMTTRTLNGQQRLTNNSEVLVEKRYGKCRTHSNNISSHKIEQSDTLNQMPFTLSHDRYLNGNVYGTSENPVEMQFRPSNPLSYGCQTNPSNNTVFDQVFLVDSIPSGNCVLPPSPTVLPPLVISNSGDCSIEIVSVKSLSSTEYEQYVVPSCSNQSLNMKVDSYGKKLNNYRKIKKLKNSSVSSTSVSTELITIDDDAEHLQPVECGPMSQLSTLSLTPTDLHNCCLQENMRRKIPGTRQLDFRHKFNLTRKFKKERFKLRQKARKDISRLKKLYLKGKWKFVKRKYQEKSLQVKYLKLKVKNKELKIALMEKFLLQIQE